MFSGGFGRDAGNSLDFLVCAYNTRTVNLIWDEQLDFVGESDTVIGMTVGKGLVYVTGYGGEDLLVRPMMHRQEMLSGTTSLAT